MLKFLYIKTFLGLTLYFTTTSKIKIYDSYKLEKKVYFCRVLKIYDRQ